VDLQPFKKIYGRSGGFAVAQKDLRSFSQFSDRSMKFALVQKLFSRLGASTPPHQAYPLDSLFFLDYTPILAYLFR